VAADAKAWIDLYWLPLGAGGHVVRWNGRLYEWLSARRHHRPALDLYHAGLMVTSDGVTYAIEMGPVWNVPDSDRGVVLEGPVGARRLGRFRLFRYEVRCWAGGAFPDLAEAVDSPVRITEDPERVDRALSMLRGAPLLTWGRDELRAGEMWNSNSLVAWMLARSGQCLEGIEPPAGGRAPGWGAGLVLAERQSTGSTWSTHRDPGYDFPAGPSEAGADTAPDPAGGGRSSPIRWFASTGGGWT
jgi:hypothetical protein